MTLTLYTQHSNADTLAICCAAASCGVELAVTKVSGKGGLPGGAVLALPHAGLPAIVLPSGKCIQSVPACIKLIGKKRPLEWQ
jgi:hypothetical protein